MNLRMDPALSQGSSSKSAFAAFKDEADSQPLVYSISSLFCPSNILCYNVD